MLAYVLERRAVGEAQAGRSAAVESAMPVVGALLGALMFAGSLAEGGAPWWPGLLAGALCAALGFAAVAGLLGRARRRVAPSVAVLLTLYAEGFAIALAGLSILFPPVALVALVLFAVLLARGRSSRAAKFEGLRVLR